MSIIRVAITGGPAGGKTTVLNMISELYGKQVLTMPEVASILFNGGYPKPGADPKNNERWDDNFQDSVITVQRNMENEFIELSKGGPYKLVTFDRGLLDGCAYLGKGLEFFLKRFGLDEQDLYDRYDMVIHLESVAVSNPKLYAELKATNPARYENATQAASRDESIKEAWKKHPNRIIVSSVGGMDAVKKQVMALLDVYLNTEIERKFLLAKMPNIVLPEEAPINQGYLPLNTEVRVRNIGDEYYLTIKSQGGISRQECEVRINREAYEQLWDNDTKERRVNKTRYFIPHGEYTIELDRYHDHLDSLITLECEFKTLEEAEDFVLPDWAGDAVEITEAVEYKNRALALKGIPRVEHIY